MDAKELYEFFNTKDKSKDSAVIMTVKGRQFPVNIFYTRGMLFDKDCFISLSDKS